MSRQQSLINSRNRISQSSRCRRGLHDQTIVSLAIRNWDTSLSFAWRRDPGVWLISTRSGAGVYFDTSLT